MNSISKLWAKYLTFKILQRTCKVEENICKR